MKKTFCCTALIIFAVSGIFAQQITRFAVIDMSKVYTTFFKDSKPVRDFEDQSARVQAEIDRMNKEIQDLKIKQVDAEMKGDTNLALKLENDIYRKSEYLKTYFTVKTQELQDKKKRLSQSSDFWDQINTELRLVAESEGYSMVINLNENKGILWFSPTVDITDKLIQSLQTKAKR
ncbi:outer membrane protein [Spirochaetia bacterium]|nr:outer membrane protein [Spirochaetia bacterium]